MACTRLTVYLCALLCLLSAKQSVCSSRVLSAVKLGPGQYQVVEGRVSNAFVSANFTDNIRETGWVAN